ncbi:MAG: IS4 family transposase, partial [Macellibacteroides fermentans]|uniref:IS4 family transposase n=1 Tax=Macellibacteroides fermentans TaxID=879969 RepID=UPI003AC799ED
HHSKCYHLGIGRNVSRSSLARANQDRDYHIFEEYAYYLINEAIQKRATEIFKLGGNIYAFDSTTIDLCLAVFWWAKFRKKKGAINVHTLYDVETQIPAFIHITEAAVHDSKAMKEIPYESGSYYIFDRAYNNFKMLYKVHQIDAFFVVRAKKNLQYKSIKWKRRLAKNVLSDVTIELIGFYPKQYYPEQFRLVRYWDEEQKREFVFLTNGIKLSESDLKSLETTVNHCDKYNTNILEDRDNWLKVGSALANELGEQGRDFFHRLSNKSKKYDKADCDAKYDEMIDCRGRYNYSLGTIFHIFNNRDKGGVLN